MANKPLRVAFFSYMGLTYWGGLEKYVTKTSRELSDRYPELEIYIVTTDPKLSKKIHFWHGLYFGQLPGKENLQRESLDSILTQLGPKVTYIRVGSFRALKHSLKDYDVIYSKNELIEAFILKFLLGYKNLPTVIFGCHTPLHYPANSRAAKLHNFLYDSAIYRSLASGVSRFHALNDMDSRVLHKAFPGKGIAVIPNPFDFDDFFNESSIHPLNLKLDPMKMHVLWVGRLTEAKGVGSLAHIVDLLNEDSQEWVSWTVAGDGPERALIENLAKKWSNVNYLGHVDGQAMASLYKQHDLFLSTSKWESFGFTSLEAQCFGLPVIALDTPGTREIIDQNVNGYIASSDKELAALLKDFLLNRGLEKQEIMAHIRRKFNQNTIYGQLNRLLVSGA